MTENGDRREETARKIELGRLRFLGREATTAKDALSQFVDHAHAYGYPIAPAEARAAFLDVYLYLETFAKDAEF